MSAFIIAEAGVNHNGSERQALELVEAAAATGADAVKFQTFRADRLVRPGAQTAAYQRSETGVSDQHALLQALELPAGTLEKLVERSRSLGIEFMSTPFDEESVDLLVDLGIRRIKVASGDLVNHPLLEHLAAKDLPLILSTGMSTMEEIEESVAVVAAVRQRLGLTDPLPRALTILHCTSNYPAEFEDVNLRAMLTIADRTGLPVGYSDHTLGLAVSPAAVAMGASVIEKHFTLDRALPGPDHRASLLPQELQAMVRQIRDVERSLGSPVKAPTTAELPIRALVRRSVTTLRAVRCGSQIVAEDIALLRPGDGIPPARRAEVIGRRAARDIPAGTTLQWRDLS